MRHIVGTAQLGASYGTITKTVTPSAEQAAELVDLILTLSQGLDTARDYPNSEATLGNYLPLELPASFDLATKLTAQLDPTSVDPERLVEESVFQSCSLLKRDRIPTLLLHRCAHLTMFDGALRRRLIRLRERGVIGRIGVSCQGPDELIEATRSDDVQCIQIPYNILDHRWDEEVLRALKRSRPDLDICVRSVFLQGVLTRSAEAWPVVEGYRPEVVIDWLTSACRRSEADSIKQLCIAYCRSKEWIDGIVIGAESPVQVRDNVLHFDRPALIPEMARSIDASRPKVPRKVLNPSQWLMP